MTSVPPSGAKSVTPGGSVAGGHTKGRWRFDDRSMTGAVWSEDEFIASVYPNAPDDWDCVSDYERIGEMRANARLIAAAPELLDALSNMVRWAQEPSEDASGMLREQGWLNCATAAIAKATAGETRNAEPIHRRDGDSA